MERGTYDDLTFPKVPDRFGNIGGFRARVVVFNQSFGYLFQAETRREARLDPDAEPSWGRAEKDYVDERNGVVARRSL